MANTTTQQLKFEKDKAFVRSWLLGKEWYTAVRALDWAESFHAGMRKDGVTPEFHHQIQIALNARTLIDLMLYPEETLCAVFLHDVPEDFDVEFEVIYNKFGDRVTGAVRKLTKKHKGSVKPYETYFEMMETDPIASIVKGLDRCHNVWTMKNAFSDEKILSYSEEIDTWFLPMLKAARRNFPEQEKAYHNIAQQLRSMRDIYNWAISRENT
jgi:(p)ppGpp synthase/HD superfamily hydrolase